MRHHTPMATLATSPDVQALVARIAHAPTVVYLNGAMELGKIVVQTCDDMAIVLMHPLTWAAALVDAWNYYAVKDVPPSWEVRDMDAEDYADTESLSGPSPAGMPCS